MLSYSYSMHICTSQGCKIWNKIIFNKWTWPNQLSTIFYVSMNSWESSLKSLQKIDLDSGLSDCIQVFSLFGLKGMDAAKSLSTRPFFFAKSINFGRYVFQNTSIQSEGLQVRECLVRPCFHLKVLLQWLHSKGFSKVCFFMCCCKLLEVVQTWLHWSHVNGHESRDIC